MKWRQADQCRFGTADEPTADAEYLARLHNGERRMYGVPAALDLTFLHGREVVQVRLGLYQIQIHFHPEAEIAVEGEWELLDAEGRELDRSEAAGRTKPFQLHRLLGRSVVGSDVSAPQWFALRFERGEVLKVFDRSTEFESFSIQPGNIVV